MADILVLGGSYFLGKRFVKLALNTHNLTVFNRGNNPLNIAGVTEIIGDRHNLEDLNKLTDRHYDVVVDFCAYSKNDINTVCEKLKDTINQYIFISTVDVYKRGLDKYLDESAPFEDTDFGGEAGAYISGKVALEKEIAEASKVYGFDHTVIRPAFIYGPDNYAPREGIYFHWINSASQILHPADATGEFQLVYVDDVAKAVLNVVGNEKAYDKAFNLAPFQMETYESFAQALKDAMDLDFEIVNVTVELINEKQIPLPFPLTKDESNWYDGKAALELIGQYTNLSEGLKQTISGTM